MALEGNLMRPVYSDPAALTHGANSPGASAATGDGSLGGRRSGSSVLDAFAFFGAGSGANSIFDAALTAAAQGTPPGRYAFNRTGAAAGYVSRIALNNGADRITFADPFPATPTTGSVIDLYNKELLFRDVTVQESVDGLTDYRCFYFLNLANAASSAGADLQFDDYQVHAELLQGDPDDVNIDVATFATVAAGGTTIPTAIADRFTVPNLVELGGSTQDFAKSHAGTLLEVPPSGARVLPFFTGLPIWIRRQIQPGTQFQEVAFQIRIEFSGSTPSQVLDPDPYFGQLICHFDVSGDALNLSFSADRQITQAGGSRLTATVDTDSGSPLEGVDVDFQQTVGPGVLTVGAIGSTNRVTNAQGQAFASYEAPAGDGNVGDTITFESEVKI